MIDTKQWRIKIMQNNDVDPLRSWRFLELLDEIDRLNAELAQMKERCEKLQQLIDDYIPDQCKGLPSAPTGGGE